MQKKNCQYASFKSSFVLLVDKSSPTKLASKKNTDFYKDSNVEEIKSAYHILEEFRCRVLELLKEWPEQPTLKTVTY